MANILAHRADNKIDHGKVLKQYLRGLTQAEIADTNGVSRQAISQVIAPFKALIANPEALAAYRENEAALIDSARMGVLESLMDRSKAKKDSISGYSMAYGVLFDKQALMRGKATSRIEVAATDDAIDAEIVELQAEIAAIDDSPGQAGG